MKALVGAFLAIMAINSAPGLPAGLATYLTVAAAAAAAVIHVVTRRRRKRANSSTSAAAGAAAPGPTIIQHIYTTQPVYTGMYRPDGYPQQPMRVHSERVGQVILPDSIYQIPKAD
ncbi:hypothetical protein [Mycobacterium hubeiense]|uniref:hypothetical protein n=1 Tax=Mycobacterium hubeiense TaxID=1867256 RepID=UPI000C7EF69A|nr:hypothetical protein [Mycobacterium sp. QGD 101]